MTNKEQEYTITEDNSSCIIQQIDAEYDEFDNEYRCKTEVLFIAGSFVTDEAALGLQNSWLEVIGNIFENPELLK